MKKLLSLISKIFRPRINREDVVRDLWIDEFVNPVAGVCSLCGNSGAIDTRGRAISAAGIDAGRVNFCICPNGRGKREYALHRRSERIDFSADVEFPMLRFPLDDETQATRVRVD
jgi:hypothetical protein